MKRIISCILSVVSVFCLAIGAVGCGRPDTNVVRLIAHTEQETVLEPFLNIFREETGIQVEVMYGVDQTSSLDSVTPPDLLMVSNLQLGLYDEKLEDLTPWLEEEMINDFFPSTLEMMESNNVLKALPMNANVSLLYYNKKIFNANADAIRTGLGLSANASVYPQADWDYDDFATVGKILTKYDDNDNPTQWGCTSITNWWGEWLTYVRQNGGDFMTDDGNVVIDSDGFRTGMQFYKDKIYGQNAFSFNPMVIKTGYSNLGGFGGKKTAMEIGGHVGNWLVYNDLVNFDWDVEVLPTPVGKPNAKGAEVSVEGYGLNKDSTNKKEAVELLKYMFSEKGQMMFAQLNKLLPTNTFKNYVLSTPKEERNSPQNMEAVFKTIENGVALPKNSGFEKAASSIIQGDLNKWLSNEISSVDTLVVNMKKSVEDYLKTIE